MKRYIKSPLALWAVTILYLGCSGPSSQLSSCQQDKEKLLATIRHQRDAGRALKEQVASLETRLDQAEKELALRTGGTRVSSRPVDSKTPVKAESLPWRSPPAKGGNAPSGKQKTTSQRAPANSALAEMAKEDRRLIYDSEARTAQLDLPIGFERDGTTLSAEGKRQLDEVARLLKSDEAKSLRVMIAGFGAGRPSTTAPVAEGEERFTSARQVAATRAQTVADYLDRHGIAQDRLGVTGVGQGGGPVGVKGDKLAASGGVQIYLLEPDAPIVGWNSGQTVRR